MPQAPASPSSQPSPSPAAAHGASILDVALAYAARGWPVFPVGADKTPRTKHGFHDATTSEAQIRAWWKRWPDAGIGIPTGPASGLAVLDVDAKHGDPAHLLDALAARHGDAPTTATSRTGGGGLHLVYALGSDAAGRHEVKSSTSKLAPGIDTRGDGGYFVAPPSLHESGRRYQWTEEADDGGPDLDATPLASSDWLIGAMRAVDSDAAKRPTKAAKAQPATYSRENDRAWVSGAVEAVALTCDRDTWWKVGMALYHDGFADGRALWEQWSARRTAGGAKSYPAPGRESSEWDRLGTASHAGIGLGSLWHAAERAGWTPPRFAAVYAPPPLDAAGRLLADYVHQPAGYVAPATARPEADPFAELASVAFPLASDAEPPANEWGYDLDDAPETTPAVIVATWLATAPGRHDHAYTDALRDRSIFDAFIALRLTDPAEYTATMIAVRASVGSAEAHGRFRKLVDDTAASRAKVASGAKPMPAHLRPARIGTVAAALPTIPEDYPADVTIPEGYELSASGVWREKVDRKSGETTVVRVCSAPLVISGRSVDAVEGTHMLEVAWYGEDARWYRASGSRDRFATARKVPDLAARGLPVTSGTAADVVDYLAALEEKTAAVMPLRRTATRCGWYNSGTEDAPAWGFLRGQTRHGEAPHWRVGEDAGADAIAASVGAHGVYGTWRSLMLEASRFPKIRAALSAAVAPILLRGMGLPNFAVDLAGDTSRGKSTATRCAQSIWGPTEKLTQWNSSGSGVGFESRAVVLNDLLLSIDDTKQARMTGAELATTVYDIVSGVERLRGAITSSGAISSRAQRTFRTVLLTTSENPLSECDSAGGLRARVLQLWGSPLEVKSDAMGAFSEVIQRVTAEHYGHAGALLVDHVLGWTGADWSKRRESWRAWQKVYTARAAQVAPDHPVSSRLSGYASTLAVAWDVLASVCDLPASVDDATPAGFDLALWDAALMRTRGADVASEAFAHVMDWIASTPALVLVGERRPSSHDPTPSYIARVTERGERAPLIELVTLGVRRELDRAGFQSAAMHAAWTERKWIVSCVVRLHNGPGGACRVWQTTDAAPVPAVLAAVSSPAADGFVDDGLPF